MEVGEDQDSDWRKTECHIHAGCELEERMATMDKKEIAIEYESAQNAQRIRLVAESLYVQKLCKALDAEILKVHDSRTEDLNISDNRSDSTK